MGTSILYDSMVKYFGIIQSSAHDIRQSDPCFLVESDKIILRWLLLFGQRLLQIRNQPAVHKVLFALKVNLGSDFVCFGLQLLVLRDHLEVVDLMRELLSIVFRDGEFCPQVRRVPDKPVQVSGLRCLRQSLDDFFPVFQALNFA